MTVQEFRLPDIGEGLTEADILAWHVAPGDEVALNAVVVEVETAKAAVELPSPFAGVVVSITAAVGETVPVGNVLFTVATSADAGKPAATRSQAEAAALTDDHGADDGSRSVLVGYGPSHSADRRRPRQRPAAPVATVTLPEPQSAPGADRTVPAQGRHEASAATKAKPPVRKLARDLGVELARVSGTGPSGSITRTDLHAFHAAAQAADPNVVSLAAAPTVVGRAGETRPAPETVPNDENDVRTPIRGVRKAIAHAMVASAFTAPHVTEFLTVDVTPTLDLVQRLRHERSFADVKVTPLLIVASALLSAARSYPDINAHWDDANQEIVRKTAVNLGIAAATPRGLIVPNIKDAGRLPLRALALALAELTAVARDGRTTPAAMSGGTITITNVGVFGVDAATPILNPGEAAILCFGAIRETPWVHEGTIVARHTTQLSLSFDHRLVDGELGSRVLAHVGAVLSDPLWQLALS